ncbi:MAG: nucleotidyltransferase family protein [Burkholderiales bacterium]|nr:MAG: nucleotidyltransferase family protein [Burkholderiales bacterium]
MHRTAVVLLTSGLSRRYGAKDKMLADLGGQPLVDHAAHAIAQLDPLARVAVCPSERPQIGERLTGRFVIAVNKKPKLGLGHSIAVGVSVALQFKPDAILLAMGDMPFIEPWVFDGVVSRLSDGADIVHAGSIDRPHPPTAFGPATFDQLKALDGDDGAKRIIGQGGFSVVAFNAPAPLLLDVDTREDLDLARSQFAIRKRHRGSDDLHRIDALSRGESQAEIASIDLEEMPLVGRRVQRSNRR